MIRSQNNALKINFFTERNQYQCFLSSLLANFHKLRFKFKIIALKMVIINQRTRLLNEYGVGCVEHSSILKSQVRAARRPHQKNVAALYNRALLARYRFYHRQHEF